MGWEPIIISVMGECDALENTNLTNTSFTVINNFPEAINNDRYVLPWTKASKYLLWTDIINNSAVTLFGLPLKDLDGEDTNKVLCCRVTFYNKDENGKYLFNNVIWSIYDRDTASYTNISVWSGGTGYGGNNCLDHRVAILFHARMETFDNVEQLVLYGGCGHITLFPGDPDLIDVYTMELQGLPITTYLPNYTVDIGEIEFSPEFGPASEPEGYEPEGGFDDSSDTIAIPSKPQSVLSLGFINVYKCDAGSLTQLGSNLFPDIQFPTSLTDVGPVLAAVSDSIWNAKLIDYVISVHCVPGDVPAGNPTDIKIGTRTMLGIYGKPISDEYVDFDFGSISIDKYYKSYVDDMTEIQLYLPFYGFISLRPEEVIDGEIKVTYRFNVIDGSFTAFVLASSGRSRLKDSVIGQYGGSCVVHLPVSNASYASMFSSLIGAGAGVAAGAVAGGAGALAASLAASNGVFSAAQGADVKKSNSYNASSSFMTRRKPYLIVSRPVASVSTRYNTENGLPSNVAMQIGDCSGFTQAENAILDGIPCTDGEKERIRSMLRAGIIIK